MATDVKTVADAIATAINDANIFTEDATFTYDPSADLDSLETERIDVFIDDGKSKERASRSQVNVKQPYGVVVRKRFSGDELDGEGIDSATLEDYLSKCDDLEDILWRGRFSTAEAAIDSVEILSSFSADELREHCLLKYVIRFNCSWFINK